MLVLLRPARTFPASFDCQSAATIVERTICSDEELSQLDDQLADTYKAILRIDASDWRSQQHAWLTHDRNRCATAGCLKALYRERLAFLNDVRRRLSAAASSPRVSAPDAPSYFQKPPYINPRIVETLTTWGSDDADQVVAVNLTGAQHSNRFGGLTKTRMIPGTKPYIYYQRQTEKSCQDEGEFGYVYLGTTSSGIHVLRTTDSQGGSAVFEDLLFVVFESDRAIDQDRGTLKQTRPRLLLKLVGQYGLGDRPQVSVRLNGDDLLVVDAHGTSRSLRIPGVVNPAPAVHQ